MQPSGLGCKHAPAFLSIHICPTSENHISCCSILPAQCSTSLRVTASFGARLYDTIASVITNKETRE